MSCFLKIELDKCTYSLDVLTRTAYALADKLAILIKQSSSQIDLEISQLDKNISVDEANALVIQYLNDFSLRQQIKNETLELQKIIIKAALQECGF